MNTYNPVMCIPHIRLFAKGVIRQTQIPTIFLNIWPKVGGKIPEI